jgi:hypothetical protein
MEEKFLILIFSVCLFLWIILPHSEAVCMQENTCPTSSDQCLISCGGSNTGQVGTVGNSNYFNYTLTAPKRVKIKATLQALTDYELYANWTAGQCPSTTSSDANTTYLGLGFGGTRTLTRNLTRGTYQLMVWLQNRAAAQTYTLNLGCEEIPCRDCPITEQSCSIGCGQTYYDLANATPTPPEYYYFKFTLSEPKEVTITVDPTTTLTDYKICVKDDTNQCPTESDVCVDNLGVSGSPEILKRNFAAGTYYLMIKLKQNLGVVATYDLNMSCGDIQIQPTIVSPENKTYVANSVDLIAKCVGDFHSYDINYSLDNGNNFTFASSVPNDTESLPQALSQDQGSHNVYVTCINGSFYRSSVRVYFTRINPVYNLDTWTEGPSVFTISKAEPVNIYVRNLGNIRDSYNISVRKEAYKDGNSVPHLVHVSMPSNRISSVEPNRTGNTFATITLLGPITNGRVTFNVTSDSQPSIHGETFIEFKPGMTGSPINLPEFGLMGLFQIFIFIAIFQIILSLKKNIHLH